MIDKNSIIYDSLSDEYHRNLQMQEQALNIINSSPKRSLQLVNRGKAQYYYLKYREGNKIQSLYIGEKSRSDVTEIKSAIAKRKKYVKILKELKVEEQWLVKTLQIRK